MIQKRLIFTWLGQTEVPEWGFHSMRAFQRVNPDFELMFVRESDIEHPANEDLRDMLDMLHSKEDNAYKRMYFRGYAQKHLREEIYGIPCRLSDAFRMFLMNRYGGIYLDLDTFPVKPFDERLLSRDFKVFYLLDKVDLFFQGFSKGCVDEGRYIMSYADLERRGDDALRILYPTKSIKMMANFKPFRKLFMDCKLEYGQRVVDFDLLSNYYIDHYYCRTHQKNVKR